MDFNFTATAYSTLDVTSGIDNLSPQVNKPGSCTLSNARNVRFRSEGGVGNRSGFTQLVDMATSAKVDDSTTLKKYDVTFWKSGTKIHVATKAQLDLGLSYDIGLTRTATEKDFLYPHESDVYATNETDNFTRIAVSKATLVIADSDVVITVDDIGQFAASGTIYVNGDSIAYTGVSGSTLTGVTGIATGGHAVNSIITQTSTPSGAPKGYCMGDLEGSALIGKGASLYSSLPSTDQEPELFYDFNIANGAVVKRLQGDIKCIKTGLKVAMIGMIDGIDVSEGFEPNTGALITVPLTRVHGIPNNRCIIEMDNKFALLTNEGRILIAAQGLNGFELIDNPNTKQNFDYPVSKYIKDNKDQEDNSQNFVHYNPASKLLKATILMKSGLTEDIVCQTEIGAWSIDDSKNIRCRTNVQGAEYAGDDSDDKIHRDEYGTTDNGTPIISTITTGRLRLGSMGITGDYLGLTYGGVLSANGIFKQRIIYNSTIDETEVTAEEMVELGQMSLESGISLGEEGMGAEVMGGEGVATEVFSFNRPVEIMFEAEFVQLEFEISDEGGKLEIRSFEISGEHEGTLLINNS